MGEGEQQIRQIALHIEQQRRDALQQRLFHQHQPQAGLPAAGRAQEQRVRRQLLERIAQRLRRGFILVIQQASEVQRGIVHIHLSTNVKPQAASRKPQAANAQ